MATMVQQELKPQRPGTPHGPDDDPDDFYDDEPRRRSWAAIMSVLLALSLVFVGYQWHQAAGRAEFLASQVGVLRADGETQRLRAEDAQRQVADLGRRVTALGAERDALGERVAALERAAKERVTVARDARGERRPAVARGTPSPRVTPVVAKKTR